MTRSLGDFMFKMNLRTMSNDSSTNALSSEPDIQEISFSNKKGALDIILMGCDGIYDGITFDSDDDEFGADDMNRQKKSGDYYS